MADATIITLTKDVVNDLNTVGRWSQAFTAARKYQPKYDFEDLTSVQVQVVPLSWTKKPDSRKEWKHTYTIGIGIHIRLGPLQGEQNLSSLDVYMKLVEEISDYYEDVRPTVSDCVLTGVSFGGATGAPYAHEVVEPNNQFTSVIQLTFDKWR